MGRGGISGGISSSLGAGVHLGLCAARHELPARLEEQRGEHDEDAGHAGELDLVAVQEAGEDQADHLPRRHDEREHHGAEALDRVEDEELAHLVSG